MDTQSIMTVGQEARCGGEPTNIDQGNDGYGGFAKYMKGIGEPSSYQCLSPIKYRPETLFSVHGRVTKEKIMPIQTKYRRIISICTFIYNISGGKKIKNVFKTRYDFCKF